MRERSNKKSLWIVIEKSQFDSEKRGKPGSDRKWPEVTGSGCGYRSFNLIWMRKWRQRHVQLIWADLGRRWRQRRQRRRPMSIYCSLNTGSWLTIGYLHNVRGGERAWKGFSGILKDSLGSSKDFKGILRIFTEIWRIFWNFSGFLRDS